MAIPASNSKAKVIVFDQKNDIRRHLKKDATFDFSKYLRDAGVNVYRVINASIDRNAPKLFGIQEGEDTTKTVVEIMFPQPDPEKPVNRIEAQKILLDVSSLITKKGYKVIRSVLFDDPREEKKTVGKILVDIPINDINKDPAKKVVTNRK